MLWNPHILSKKNLIQKNQIKKKIERQKKKERINLFLAGAIQ